MRFVSDWEMVLGVPMFFEKRKPKGYFYSKEEDEYLIKHYPHELTSVIARKLERDEKSVHSRAKRLGLQKTEQAIRNQRIENARLEKERKQWQ